MSNPDLRSASLANSVNALLTTLKQTQTYDYLRAAANPELTKYLLTCSRKDATPSLTPPPSEVIQFADEVVKINRKQKRQERVLIITDKALYNFAPGSFKSAKRRILLQDIRGLILSRCSEEIVFQVTDSYDYRYEIRRRSEVLEMLSRAYEKVTSELSPSGESKVLMVTFSEEKELKDMVLTKDVLKHLEQVAIRNAIITNEFQNHSSHQSDSIGRDDNHNKEASLNGQDSSPTSAAAALPSSSSFGQTPSSLSSTMAALPPTTPTSTNGIGSSLPPGVTPGMSMKVNGSVRQSLITHGATLLAPSILAKLQQTQSGQYPAVATASNYQALIGSGQFTASAGSAGTLPTPKMNTVGTMGGLGSGSYQAAKHGSIIIGSGSHPPLGQSFAATTSSIPNRNRSASKVVSSMKSENGSAASAHAFRDPNSRVEGWLTKQKGSSKNWDRKYFILTHQSLQYYAPRIKGNVKLKIPVTVNRFNSEISLNSKKPSSSSSDPGAFTPSNDAPLIMLRIESSTHLKGKDALILAFGSEDDASAWSEAFLHRNTVLPPSDLDQYTHMEGWLLRKEKEKWIRRYVVLTQDRCWFFEMSLKGSVEFTKGVSAHSLGVSPTEEPQATNFAGRYALTRFAYRWNVSDSVRIFHLAADSEEDMNHWIEAIDQVNREHGKSGGTLTTPDGDEALPVSSAIKLPDEFIEAVEQPAPEGCVTFVFTDVQNSTNLWEKVPDAMDAALEQHDRILRELLKRYNGYEVKTEGDAFMVTFFNSIDAILWCLDVQMALLNAQWSDEFCNMKAAKKEVVSITNEAGTNEEHMTFNGIRIRMGIHTGYPNCRRNPVTGRMDYFGPVVNRSARVSDTGHGGQVVCTQEVIDQLNSSKALSFDPRFRPELIPSTEDFGCHSLKGINEPVRIFQLMPAGLKHRVLPPIRTTTNEEKEKAKSIPAASSSSHSTTE